MTELTLIESKYLRMMENIKRANKKYFEKNRDQMNAKSRQYYKSKLATNTEYKEKRKQYFKEYFTIRRRNTRTVMPNNQNIKF